MQVKVHNNDIERAIKELKRKLIKEGVLMELKERRYYDKPSVKIKKKRIKAAKRNMKKNRGQKRNKPTGRR